MKKFLVTYSQYNQEYLAHDFSYDKDKLFLTNEDESIAAIIMLASVNSIEIRTV